MDQSWSKWEEWDYDEILKKRIWIMENAPHNFELQEILKELCRQDPLFFFTFFAWTLNPPSDLPFILYPFQKDLIRWIENRIKNEEIGLTEKSRQMGCSWVFVTYFIYKWLFEKNFFIVIGSRKSDLVDLRGSQATLFYKADYQIEKLPKWILPKGFDPEKDRRQMILVNQSDNNVILGESANPSFARGASANIIYFDEFAFWEYAQSAWASASRASKCRICVSTPFPNSFFKILRFSKEMKLNNRVKSLHWSLLYNQEWYEKQKESMSADTLAQEIDLSYSATGRGRVYEEIDLCDIGKYEYNHEWPLYTSSDWGIKDPTAIIWAQKDLKNKKFYIIDTYQNEQKTIQFYVPFFTGIITPDNPYKYEYTKEEKLKIEQHREWKRPKNFGDPAGKQKNQVTDTSVIKELNKNGVHVYTNDRANHFAPRREATKRLLRQMAIDENQLLFIESIKQSSYPQRREGSMATKGVQKPIHNQFCLHGDTRIRTLEGWVPIKKLVNNKKIWLWAYSTQEKRLIPVIATSAQKTGTNVSLIEIGLDNGNSIKCTLNHKFMLRDETWREAKDLKIDDALMPLIIKNNHRIRFIKKTKNADVYDLTVPQYHNFVAEGVVVHNSHFRSALEYFAVNVGLDSTPPKRFNYLKKKNNINDDEKISEKQVREEKKKHIIRYSYKAY